VAAGVAGVGGVCSTGAAAAFPCGVGPTEGSG
jgi:hypothetical protein